MRRLIYFVCAVAVCCSLTAIPVYADEITEGDAIATETVDETVEEDSIEEATEDAVEEAYTMIGRIQEYVSKYMGEILTTGGDAVLAAAYVGYFIWDKRKNKDVKTQLATIAGNTGNVAVSQGGVVEVANNLIDGYNVATGKISEMMAIYEKLKEKDTERDMLLARVLVQNQAMLEIIQTAYANSQLPQGTKDLVIYKYAKCLALADDDEKLASIIGAIHAELTPAIEAEAEEPVAEVEEAQEVEA